MFAVKKNDEPWWVSRKLFVLSNVDDGEIMGQYIRDIWYMESIYRTTVDIRRYLVIPIKSNTKMYEVKQCIQQWERKDKATRGKINRYLQSTLNIDWVYNFELTAHAINKYLDHLKEKETDIFELHHIGDRYGNGTGAGPYMKLLFPARLLKYEEDGDTKYCMHISNPEFQTYR